MNNDWVNAEEEAAEELSWSPRTEQEPVAWMYSRSDVFAGNPVTIVAATTGKDFAFQKPHFDQKPLFLHPAPKRKPLTTEKLKKEFEPPYNSEWMAFCFGVRWAEKMHHISGGEE